MEVPHPVLHVHQRVPRLVLHVLLKPGDPDTGGRHSLVESLGEHDAVQQAGQATLLLLHQLEAGLGLICSARFLTKWRFFFTALRVSDSLLHENMWSFSVKPSMANLGCMCTKVEGLYLTGGSKHWLGPGTATMALRLPPHWNAEFSETTTLTVQRSSVRAPARASFCTDSAGRNKVFL